MSDLQLIEAAKNADIAAVKELLASGADVNQQDEKGWTPLNWAAGKGALDIVKLLIDGGAELFKVGRDQRTPYMIALAAGRVEVVKYLRQAEDNHPGEKPERPQRPYCKAYHLKDLRKFAGWSEDRINWKEKRQERGKDEDGANAQALADDDVVFIHQDLTVTQSMWHSENVIFNRVAPDWEEFCATVLKFRVPDDIDFIVPAASQS